MLDGALALPEYIIEFDFSPEMGKVRPPHGVHPTICDDRLSVSLLERLVA